MTTTILHGDNRHMLPTLPACSVQTVVTSPPYFGLRDYGADGQIGLEATPAEYVAALVAVFREVRRVLRDDGTLFLNLGDSYSSSNGATTGGCSPKSTLSGGGGKYRAGSKNERMFNQSAERAGRAPEYDTDDTGAQGSQANDQSSGSLYDGRKDAELLRNFGIDTRPEWLQALASLPQIQGYMEGLSAHLPNADLVGQQPIERSSFATLHLVQTAIHEVERPLSSLASKIGESSLQPLDAQRAGGALSAYLLSLRSFAACAHRFARMLGEPQGTLDYSQCIASLSEELTHHIRCTDACYSLALSWLNPPYIQPQYTTPKQLLGIPWRVAFALQDDGWVLRSDIIWSKPNAMPESVKDRPTKAHEYLFLFAKSPRYYYNAEAIAEPVVKGAAGSTFTQGKTGVNGMGRVGQGERADSDNRNRRSVWSVATKPFSGTRLIADYVGADGTPYIASADCPVHSHLSKKRSGQTQQYDAPQDQTLSRSADTHYDPVRARLDELSASLPRANYGPADLSSDDRLEHSALEHTTESTNGHKRSALHPLEDAAAEQTPGHTTRSCSQCEHQPDSSGCSCLAPLAPANEHSNGSHKTAHVPATTQPYTPSAQMVDDTRRTSTLPASDVKRRSRALNRIAEGSDQDEMIAQTLFDTADIQTAALSAPAVLRLNGSIKHYACSCEPSQVDHFAVMPEALVEPCILAGSRPGDTVLDPFAGSGTVLRVAERLQRDAVGIELNPSYIELAERRTDGVQVSLLTEGY